MPTLWPDWPDVPILMATGYNDELVAEEPRPSGRDALDKPYWKPQMLDRVSNALAKQRSDSGRRIVSDFCAAEE